MELTTAILTRAEYLRAAGVVVEFLKTHGLAEILVTYGFGCECPEERLYDQVAMPPDGLLPYMERSEHLGYYRVGKDNLHVQDAAGRFEFLFCHESDIHFPCLEAEAIKRLEELWAAAGVSRAPASQSGLGVDPG